MNAQHCTSSQLTKYFSRVEGALDERAEEVNIVGDGPRITRVSFQRYDRRACNSRMGLLMRGASPFYLRVSLTAFAQRGPPAVTSSLDYESRAPATQHLEKLTRLSGATRRYLSLQRTRDQLSRRLSTPTHIRPCFGIGREHG